MAVTPPTPINEWDHHKYKGIEPTRDGVHVSGETCLICAGPPMLAHTGLTADLSSTIEVNNMQDSVAYPIALVQGVSISQQRQQSRIYEVGSVYDYLITGKNIGGLTLSRVYYSSASLMRVLYAYYGTTGVQRIDALFDTPLAAADVLNDIYISPGSDRIFINMLSDLFRNPVGLMIIMNTTQNNALGIFYLERCMIGGHSLSFDSQGIIVQENASLSFTKVATVRIRESNILAAMTNSANLFDIGGGL